MTLTQWNEQIAAESARLARTVDQLEADIIRFTAAHDDLDEVKDCAGHNRDQLGKGLRDRLLRMEKLAKEMKITLFGVV